LKTHSLVACGHFFDVQEGRLTANVRRGGVKRLLPLRGGGFGVGIVPGLSLVQSTLITDKRHAEIWGAAPAAPTLAGTQSRAVSGLSAVRSAAIFPESLVDGSCPTCD
jgi:hypothetical protein